jgi:hypothetical protein
LGQCLPRLTSAQIDAAAALDLQRRLYEEIYQRRHALIGAIMEAKDKDAIQTAAQNEASTGPFKEFQGKSLRDLQDEYVSVASKIDGPKPWPGVDAGWLSDRWRPKTSLDIETLTHLDNSQITLADLKTIAGQDGARITQAHRQMTYWTTSRPDCDYLTVGWRTIVTGSPIVARIVPSTPR